MSSLIYFAQAGSEAGAIKIGTTTDPLRRVAGLQTGCPEKIKLLAVVPGTRENERWAHGRFAELRGVGEWFRADKSLIDFIAEACANGFLWPEPHTVPPHRAPLQSVARPFLCIDDIIRASGGVSSISRASDGALTIDAVHKWRRIGCPWWRWSLLQSLCGASPEEMLAANTAARSRLAA